MIAFLKHALRQTWEISYNTFVPHLWFARSSSTAIAIELQSLQSKVSTIQAKWEKAAVELQKEADASAQQAKAGLAELNRAVSSAREAARIGGVAAQADAFEKEAGSARTASLIWLGATIVLIITGMFMVQSLFMKDGKPEYSQIVSSQVNQFASNSIPTPPNSGTEGKLLTAALLQQTIARILIITLVYTAVVWCGRNYFASRHNFTVNRHRANAMQTFQAFIAGSEDLATRDFILRQAAQCAFSPQQSGYLKDESLPTPGPISQIMDSVKPGPS